MKSIEIAMPLRTFSPVRRLGLILGLMLMSLLALPAWADPPGRVGRFSELTGQVWIYAAEGNEWIEALRNRPVTTGDRISTEGDARAEVSIGTTVLRIASGTELEVLQLDDEHVSLQLHSGSVTARLRTREAAGEFGLATEEGRFRTEAPGHYRFDRIDDTSTATTASGLAEYEDDGTALRIQPGQRVEFWKERGVAQYSISQPQRDAFADWVASRDQREERSVSSRYVSPEMTGAEELDRYGRWEQSTEYGALWTPTVVAVNWAPYRMGHWAWVSPWGWTWVDDAPWGFAPFHYGRWVWFRDRWSWAPGRYVARPVYAPALVAWVGGSTLSASISVGRAPTVGWFPLGPREVYVPGYRVSPRYVREVNITHVNHITNVTNIIGSPSQAMAGAHYVNRRLPHAVTVVPSTVVERRQPVAPAIRGVNDRVLRDLARERPRADAPVRPSFRAVPGPTERRIDEVRIRPGLVPAPAPNPPQAAPAPARPPHMVGAPERDAGERRERRGREAAGVTVPATPPNPAPPVANAPPPNRWAGRERHPGNEQGPRHERRERMERLIPSQPVMGAPPPAARAPEAPRLREPAREGREGRGRGPEGRPPERGDRADRPDRRNGAN